MWTPLTLDALRCPTAVALGNFDGLHLGHRQVIAPISRPAGLYSTVVTFRPHPVEFFTGQPRARLTPLAEKQHWLEAWGVDQLALLPFDRELAALTPEAFVETILHQQLQARLVSVGYDFCFGQGRAGNAQLLRELASQRGIEVVITPAQTLAGQRISSSAIREALVVGDLPQANALLGRPYQLWGTVMPGEQLGRQLGFPTANLHLPPDKFLPGPGVYSVWVRGEGLEAGRPGVMNLGHRPTVGGVTLRAEVHLLDWSGDLYGATLVVDLAHFLRPEQRFGSLADLRHQIEQDCALARSHWAVALEGLGC
ncbi:MAG: bifunctional riboflavin kinase/FAD synthetase [Gloeomargaritaceae cyanobacterium C42_A2020_066]|nr:bifunctional riboflavin kinase/FAD synthetase [Gloeomargaritaceae cyanobacterium C42_A2020_066]